MSQQRTSFDTCITTRRNAWPQNALNHADFMLHNFANEEISKIYKRNLNCYCIKDKYTVKTTEHSQEILGVEMYNVAARDQGQPTKFPVEL